MEDLFKELLSALNDHGVRYLVVGGWAVSFHAEPRMTKDLDILVLPDRENAEALYRNYGDTIINSAVMAMRSRRQHKKLRQRARLDTAKSDEGSYKDANEDDVRPHDTAVSREPHCAAASRVAAGDLDAVDPVAGADGHRVDALVGAAGRPGALAIVPPTLR
jgi:hypothetical protein